MATFTKGQRVRHKISQQEAIVVNVYGAGDEAEYDLQTGFGDEGLFEAVPACVIEPMPDAERPTST